jgi:hypothetical protein
VKPTIERGFDYRRMAWAHLPHTHEPVPMVPDRELGHLEPLSAELPAFLAPSATTS